MPIIFILPLLIVRSFNCIFSSRSCPFHLCITQSEMIDTRAPVSIDARNLYLPILIRSEEQSSLSKLTSQMLELVVFLGPESGLSLVLDVSVLPLSVGFLQVTLYSADRTGSLVRNDLMGVNPFKMCFGPAAPTS